MKTRLSGMERRQGRPGAGVATWMTATVELYLAESKALREMLA
jgi:hypothetical protein